MPVLVAVIFVGLSLFFALDGIFSENAQVIAFAVIGLSAMGLFGFFGPLKEFGLNQAEHMKRLGDEIYEPKIQSFLSELTEISRSLSEIKIYLLFCAAMLTLIAASVLRMAFG